MGENEIKSYKDLIVWRKAMNLVEAVYKATDKFPRSELYGLTAQIRKSVVSIPSNIAEGRTRGTRKDFRHFLLNAFGSGAELETQIEIAKKLSLVKSSDFSAIDKLLEEVMKMLNTLVKNLKPKT